MARYYVIGWRAQGREPLFFRGDDRYEIFLPFVSDTHVSRGWVRDIENARLFKVFPDFNFSNPEQKRCFSKHLDVSRVRIYPYDGELLPTQVVRPTRRPQRFKPPILEKDE